MSLSWPTLVDSLTNAQLIEPAVALQIVSVYAGTKGFLDDMRVDAVLSFEASLHEYVKTQKAALLDEVRKATKLTKEIEDALSTAIGEAKKIFLKDKPEAKVS